MSEPFRYQTEIDISSFTDEYVERINRTIDEKVLEKVKDDLAAYGYVKVVRCRDCKHATISTLGFCKYCEMFVLPDVDGYGCDSQVNLPLDFYCAWGEKMEVT